MITLIGLSDPNFTLKGDIFGEAPAMVSTKLNSLADDESSYTILLSHRPELFESYARCNIDLVLSGHAHGGQFISVITSLSSFNCIVSSSRTTTPIVSSPVLSSLYCDRLASWFPVT